MILNYRFIGLKNSKSSINPPPPRAYLFQTGLGGGGLIREGGLILFSEEGGISSPQKARMHSGKSQVQEVGGHAAEDQKQIRTSNT